MWLAVLVKQDRGHFRTPPFIQLFGALGAYVTGTVDRRPKHAVSLLGWMFQHLQDETGEGERSETWLRASQTQDAPSTLSGAHTAIASQVVKDFGWTPRLKRFKSVHSASWNCWRQQVQRFVEVATLNQAHPIQSRWPLRCPKMRKWTLTVQSLPCLFLLLLYSVGNYHIPLHILLVKNILPS